MSCGQTILRGGVLTVGALVFLYSFYYMITGSLQVEPDPTVAGAFPNPANLTLDNYGDINSRINLLQGLVNSGIFTGSVILCTLIFVVLVGYAWAQLQRRGRGRGVTVALALLVSVVPLQLLMIPLYVMIARDYGLATTIWA